MWPIPLSLYMGKYVPVQSDQPNSQRSMEEAGSTPLALLTAYQSMMLWWQEGFCRGLLQGFCWRCLEYRSYMICRGPCGKLSKIQKHEKWWVSHGLNGAQTCYWRWYRVKYYNVGLTLKSPQKVVVECFSVDSPPKIDLKLMQDSHS